MQNQKHTKFQTTSPGVGVAFHQSESADGNELWSLMNFWGNGRENSMEILCNWWVAKTTQRFSGPRATVWLMKSPIHCAMFGDKCLSFVQKLLKNFSFNRTLPFSLEGISINHSAAKSWERNIVEVSVRLLWPKMSKNYSLAECPEFFHHTGKSMRTSGELAGVVCALSWKMIAICFNCEEDPQSHPFSVGFFPPCFLDHLNSFAGDGQKALNKFLYCSFLSQIYWWMISLKEYIHQNSPTLSFWVCFSGKFNSNNTQKKFSEIWD